MQFQDYNYSGVNISDGNSESYTPRIVYKGKLRVKKRKYQSSEKVRFQSQWRPLAKDILKSSQENTPLMVARSIESYENHNRIYAKVMQVFASGQKFSMEKVKKILLDEYMYKLKTKMAGKIKVQHREAYLDAMYKKGLNPFDTTLEYQPD